MKWTEKIIQEEITEIHGGLYPYRKYLCVPNLSWGFKNCYEKDLVCVSPSGYATEIEIKISKSDLKKDKSKTHNHDAFWITNLFFCLPSEIWNDDLIKYIPSHAGIILIYEKHDRIFFDNIKGPQKTKKYKLSDKEKYEIARLGAIRYWENK